MRKVTVVSNTANTGNTMKKNMLLYFDGYLKVECILLSEIEEYDFSDSSLILASGNYQNISKKLECINLCKKPRIIAERFINYKNIEEILVIPQNTNVLIVNDNKLTAIETKIQLNSIGLDRLNYDIYYPGISSFTPRDIVITPGETNYIPYTPQKIIDIGSRNLSIGTLFDIIKTLDLPNEKNTEIMSDYLSDIVGLSRNLLFKQNQVGILNDSIMQIIEKIEYGVAYLDSNLKIISCNNKFAYYLGEKKNSILNKNIKRYIYEKEIDYKNSVDIEINTFTGVYILKKDYSLEGNKGYILTLHISNNKSKQKLKSLYKFSDYITKDKNELTMLSKAKSFSRSEASVLIQGESGTGKEILAQAIHNNSARKDKPFIPINITTITDSLIESELFGYEKGSFTGGLMEGKKGIFELANGGTIFIDEIGDAPPNIQVQLLRVLEESSIRKVGSHNEVPINVRIIAATNKNLLKETQLNKFRLDLYFRLNILPINTTPLREKKEDIFYLLQYFLENKFVDIKVEEYFEDSTLDFLKNYSWPGNIRELNNLMEYLFTINPNRKIRIEDLQPNMIKDSTTNKIDSYSLSGEEFDVLKLYYDEMKIMGRVKVSNLLKNKNIDISVGKTKGILNKLNSNHFLQYIKNRGYVITSSGKRKIDEYVEHI